MIKFECSCNLHPLFAPYIPDIRRDVNPTRICSIELAPNCDINMSGHTRIKKFVKFTI